jgi:predicted AAA+ superfamily ATPase
MIARPIWQERLAAAWKQASIVWLTGPRRVGRTVLAQSLPETEFLNCDLPSVAERLHDPESFYRSVKKGFVVFDEVHQLPDPSRREMALSANGNPRPSRRVGWGRFASTILREETTLCAR